MVQKCDQRAEGGLSGDESLGSVDGVENPYPFRVGSDRAIFLAEDAVVGGRFLNQAPHGRLGFAVGDGHRAGIGFVENGHRLAEIAAGDDACRIGQALGQGDIGFRANGGGGGKAHGPILHRGRGEFHPPNCPRPGLRRSI